MRVSFNRKKHETFAALLDNPVTDYQRENIQYYYKDLINEHFNNPPLKFEELEEDMVVWDNKREMFIKILEIATLEENCFSFEVFGWEVPIYDEQFEENRFYKKQVEE